MLSRLFISNYELIDLIDQKFYPGLNVITGETGTGKSMILSALNLLIGSRGSDKIVKDDSKKCILEATFKANPSLKSTFEELSLDWDEQLILRREYNAQGRSRAFINDTPVNVDLLKKISSQIIDIHSQNQTNNINQKEYQLELLDIYCYSAPILLDYQETFKRYELLSIELKVRKDQARKDKEEQDFIQFQFDELEKMKMFEGEMDDLESEKELLSKQEEIVNALSIGSLTISEEEQSILDQLYSLKQKYLPLEKVSPWLSEISRRLNEIYNELKDLGSEMSSRKDNLEASPKRLLEIEERLHSYYSLENKFKVHGVNELIDLMNSYSNRLLSIQNIDTEIEDLENELKIIYNELLSKGKKLSDLRSSKAIPFGNEIESRLRQLGISHPKSIFEIRSLSNPSLNGLDDIQFLFSSNKDQKARAIEEVASGGEKSRVMLAIKSIIGSKREINSMVFDEIDTGISGEVAIKTGELLSEIGKNNQVISITHLPQVASKGEFHFKVSKKIVEERTDVSMQQLNTKERVEELAEMLGGKNISESARKIAQQLLD